MTSISPSQLQQWRSTGTDHQLIDVREIYEVDICSMDGHHIPMGEVTNNLELLRKDIPLVIHCKSGRRSEAVVVYLERLGFSNARSLEGGILAWIEQVDPALEKY
jgi:adenylyltransferase/sulfurtransferase